VDILQIFTKEKADAIAEKIAQGLEEHKITGTTNIIAYALRESWLAGFEEGRKYPIKGSENS
jgi:hypothetical protein